MNTAKKALVVEGGAMRGIFAAGVLDSLLDNDFHNFDFCIGISAGSTNLAGYLTGQRGRSYHLITDFSCRPDFFNLRKFVRGGHFIDLDWLWKTAYREYRLDTFAYANQPMPLFVGTTDVASGTALYTQPTVDNLEDVLLASCAVPLAYRAYPKIDGRSQTDGGVADSIPVIKAYEMGARNITVVRSQPSNYRKNAPKAPFMIRQFFRKTPALAEAMIHRFQNYNQAVDFINHPPADCTITTVAPSESFSVSRTTTDSKALNAGYEMGLLAGQEFVSQQSSLAHQSQVVSENTANC